MPTQPRTPVAPLPVEFERRLHEGAQALVPSDMLAPLRETYPASRIDALDPRALAGLDPVDLVIFAAPIVEGAAALQVLLAIHLSLRPGGLLLFVLPDDGPALLGAAGFVHPERHAAGWTARRSAR